MGIEVTSWNEIDQADFDAAFALVSQIVAEEHPELHTRSGVIKDIVLRLHGVLGGAARVERQRFLASNSLLALQTNPDLADTTIVDQNLSNYRITRNAGANASGTITIVLSSATPIVIPFGYVFLAGSLEFTSNASYASRVSSTDLVTETDRLMTANQDGTYSFTISVTANQLGTASQLHVGDTLALSNPISGVVRVYVTQDFTGGQDAESNAALLSRLESGMALQSWSNTTGIATIINKQSGFTNAAVSVIRSGDPEMLRDRHGLFPISYGNRIDAWVKLPQTPSVTSIAKKAKYIETTTAGVVWEITLDRHDIPGVYFIETLLRTGRASTQVVKPQSMTRQYSSESTDPDIANALESGFSAFQGMVVRFIDTPDSADTLVANTTLVDYTVTGWCINGLEDLQTTLMSDSVKPPAGDIVVRSAVPCFMSVNILVDKKPATLDTAAIGTAVASLVNNTGFVGNIYSSRIASTVQPLLPAGVNIVRIQLSGLVYGPDGSQKLYRDRDVIQAPDLPTKMVTANTVGFYLDAGGVVVNEQQ